MTSSAESNGRTTIPGRPLLWLLPAIVLAAVAAVAWSTPIDATVTELRPLSTEFTFDYVAPLPDNVVYDAPTLEFGDVVFLSIVGAVDVVVGWRVPSPDALVSSGELAVTVVLESGAGWQRTLSPPAARRFTDRSVSSSVAVDFAAARDLATQIDEVVGATGPMAVRIIATVDVVGAVSRPGQPPVPLDRVSTAELVFDLTNGTATMRDLAPAGTAERPTAPSSGVVQMAETSSATGPQPASIGVQAVAQMTPTITTVPNQMSFAVVELDVRLVRYGATALASLCAFLGVSGLVLSRRAKRRGEAAYIAARYGSRLVPLRSMPDVRSSAPFELSSFDALLAVATQLGLPVMVDESGPSTTYYVADALSTFVYTASGTTRSRAVERRERKRQRVFERVEARERKEQAKRDKQRARWAADDAELQARRERERAEWQRIDAELQSQRDAVTDLTTPGD